MAMQQRTDYWQQQLDNWIDYGLSGAAFCKQNELVYHQFAYWRSKLSKSDKAPSQTKSPPGFARVTSLPEVAMRELTLTLPGGIAITGLHAGNVDVLGAILRQL